MSELLERAHKGELTMYEVYSLFDKNKISHEEAETLAGIIMNC